MIEISDLGDKSFFDLIILKKNKINDYKSLVKLIFKLQKIKLKKNYNLGKFKVKFSKYSLDFAFLSARFTALNPVLPRCFLD